MADIRPAMLSDSDVRLLSDSHFDPSLVQIPTIEAPDSVRAVDQLDGPSLASTLKLPEDSSDYLSPIPFSKPQHIFSLSDLLGEDGSLETLGSEIASADIIVASDGSFIETSSGPAARELKRRYDQLAGVGPSFRSAYVITSFVNQHGKQTYRLGHRAAASAPAASAVKSEERISQSQVLSDASQSPRTKRSSRLSMHFFTKNNLPPVGPPIALTTPSISKKLRKTRSIPDLSSTEFVTTSQPTFAVTGRGHSQSVTAMDIPRPTLSFEYTVPRQTDVFADLMGWFNPSMAGPSNFSTRSLLDSAKASMEPNRPRTVIPQPFGQNVSFNSPVFKPPTYRLPTPRHLREMQSFESGLTITGRNDDDQEDLPGNNSPVPSEVAESLVGNSRPPSAIRLSTLSLTSTFSEVTTIEPDPVQQSVEHSTTHVSPSAEALRLSSHYSTEVFNVLQTYRGLPLFEKLVPELEDTTVIKLSLAADQSAAPRDDPRFVIWGEVFPEQDTSEYTTSRDSLTDLSSSNPSISSISKRRSSKASKLRSPEASVGQLPLSAGHRVILAATIERWIAQLTSDLNYDELLVFFLTYRTYVSAVDLCHLLICRFHWALQNAPSTQDEKVRRIVRVRTFVAIRYWLVTFFVVDFIPNRELRLLISDWLNTLMHDPILKKHINALDIVRRLIKVAKECKRAHIRTTTENQRPKPPKPSSTTEDQPAHHLLGKSFAEAIRKPVVDDTESDLDLDFLPDEAKLEEIEAETGFPTDPANAHLSAGTALGGTPLTSTRPTSSLPLSSLTILQRTDHAPGPNDLPFVQNLAPIPIANRHSALSRAFVRTIGRLGRWKRALNSKQVVRPGPTPLVASSTGVSSFDLEIRSSKDLLLSNGGVDEYFRTVDSAPSKAITPLTVASGRVQPVTPSIGQTPLPSVPTAQLLPLANTENDSTSHPISLPAHAFTGEPRHAQAILDASLPTPSLASQIVEPQVEVTTQELEIPHSLAITPSSDVSHAQESTSASENFSDTPVSQATFNDAVERLREPDRPESFLSSSTDSFGAILTGDGPLQRTFPGQHNQWQFDVVSIDDLDSDTSSLFPGEGPVNPHGLRKPQKKLPNRHDFEFIRRSEVSSMGFSHESMRDSFNSSNHSGSPPMSAGGLPQPINRFHMKSLQRAFEADSNDGEEGDVEAALRKLEGQINPKTLQEKAEKVDGWVRAVQERMENGDYDYESSIFSEDEVEEFIDENDPPTDDTDVDTPPELVVSNLGTMSDDTDREDADAMPRTPIPSDNIQRFPLPPGLERNPRVEAQKPSPEDVVPLEILRSRLDPSKPGPIQSPVFGYKFADDDTPHIHSSFILEVSARVLAQHFAMIDRELFMGVKFEELVSEDWLECKEINVVDWSQYLKDRAKWKAESVYPEKTTALAAVRARFNLMVSFVIAEIVMTPPSARYVVVSRFIRIAWYSYSFSNFNTMTAIIVALQDEWVNKAMRKPNWNRLTGFENRVFRGLKQFISPADDFKIMRSVVESIVDAKHLDGTSASVISGGDSQSGKGKANSEHRPSVPTSCVPFIGIYLSQLRRLNRLPALIDPTAPNSVIGIDSETAIFDPPAHPEVFSALAPLPPSMHLEPLINVQKQRSIADVIKKLVAGQHIASRMRFDVDKKLFTRCLRLRGMDEGLLQRALALYSE